MKFIDRIKRLIDEKDTEQAPSQAGSSVRRSMDTKTNDGGKGKSEKPNLKKSSSKQRKSTDRTENTQGNGDGASRSSRRANDSQASPAVAAGGMKEHPSQGGAGAAKNMVFVEVPMCVDSDAEAARQHGPSRAPRDNSTAARRPQEDPPREDRLRRMRSLPMMLDTGMQHHEGMQREAEAQRRVGRNAAGAEPKADGASASTGPRLPKSQRGAAGSRRRSSLKALLNLDNYNFFSDVDVGEAQRAVTGDREAAAGEDVGDVMGSAMAGMRRELDIDTESNIAAVSKALPKAMARPMWSLDDYMVLKKLHQGYASNVYFARCRRSFELVVLKVYNLRGQGDLERVQLYREIRVHSRLQHHNIIQFYACFIENNCAVIVEEYAGGGDLLRFMYKHGGRLAERQAVNLVLQPFLSALVHMHSQGIIHRDIKPENCLLTDEKVLKLADFGLTVDLKEERANTRAGTLEYMAPEVIYCPTKKTPDQFKSTPGAAHYEMAADSWAVGVFAYELIVGAAPFKGEEMIETARNIVAVNVTYPSSISEMAKDFISSCLRKHSGDRCSIVELMQHPWIRMFQRRSSVHTSSMPMQVRRASMNMRDLHEQVAQGGARAIGPSPASSLTPHSSGRFQGLAKAPSRPSPTMNS